MLQKGERVTAGKSMALFQYKATKTIKTEGEELTESGTIVATDDKAATFKLNQYGFNLVLCIANIHPH